MVILGFVLAVFLQTGSVAKLPTGVSTLIAEARTIADRQGDTIWPGFAKTPYPVLLTGKDHSFLFCPVGPAQGFDDLGLEPITGCAVATRKRMFAPNLQATFPAVDGISTVVIGTPDVTERNEAAWISTLLHEHFHQMQMSQPDYYKQVSALGLAGDDDGGMWMLNYPFPYEEEGARAAFQNMAYALVDTLRARESIVFQRRIVTYHKARRAAFARVSAAQGRYAEFQLWQEGVSRYSEIALAEAAIERFRRGESPYDYSALALNLRVSVLKNLDRFDLKKNGRVSFYALGAGEALLLDRLRPNWREQYFHTGLAMAPLIYEDNTHAEAR